MKKAKQIKLRPPVVTMLGHVNHGKTSLLDCIRGTKVQLSEAGGITQNVRAHKIIFKDKKGKEHKITFIDTPGHEAFSKMRQRGANVTDIVILVVAIDDGVQPQTEEAAKFALEADVPIIVAINKIDLKGHDKNKIKRELSTVGVQVEELGGNVMCVETSAKTNKGIDELLSSIIVLSEITELKEEKPKKGSAECVVLESLTNRNLGTINLVLIKKGEIESGNYIEFEGNIKKIRAVKDEYFNTQAKGETSDAVWLLGFDKEIPIGEKITVYEGKNDYTEIKKEEKLETSKEEPSVPIDSSILGKLLGASERKEAQPVLNIVLKSENQGTLEVAIAELEKFSSKKAKINIISALTGDINEEDIQNAKNNSGVVLGFKSSMNKSVEKISKQEKILVRNYDIIYTMLKEVEEVIEGLKKPREQEVEVAKAKVKKVFKLTNKSIVAGCEVMSGLVIKGYSIFIRRPPKKDKLHTAKITSLKHAKEEIREAGKGTDCGILFEPQFDVEVGDEIVCYKIEKL